MEMVEYLQKMNRLFLEKYGLPEPDRNLPTLEQNVLTSSDQPESVYALWSEVQECIGKFNNGQRDLFIRIIGTISPPTTTENIQPIEDQDSYEET